ncbi:MAG: TolC family protein [Gammaproteobacteria bacterium]|nr:TolC family protein [Gammaproteobacteria bacterium]
MSTKTLLTVLAVSVVYASTLSAQSVSAPLTDQTYFTADQLVAWVLEANPGLAAIQAAAEAAAFRIDPAGSLDDPMLSYGVAPLTANEDRGLNQKIDFSQKIPWPGTLAAREAAARYDALAADRDVDALKLRVVAQAKAAYAEWRFVHSALDIHHATQALLDELITTAQTRYAAGRALKQDVLQAEVERADLDNQLLRLHKLTTTVQARINALLNRPPDASLPAATPIALRAGPPTLEVLQNLALAQHPDLARLDARITASESRITLAEKAFFPNFQLGVGYNELWDNADKRPIFGVSINVPLDRSKRRSELSRAQAEKRRTEFSRVERRADLLSDLAQARAEVFEAQSSVVLYRDRLIPLAAEYLEAAMADYQSGSGAFLNVITAEQRKLATDLALARARADYARRLAELERWVGGSIETAGTPFIGDQQ